MDYGDGVTQSYSFDNMGNRLTKTEGGTTETYGYNAANMLVSRDGQAYVNDLNGNTLSGGGRVNTWNSQNRLVQCVSGSNARRRDGARVLKSPARAHVADRVWCRIFRAHIEPHGVYS